MSKSTFPHSLILSYFHFFFLSQLPPILFGQIEYYLAIEDNLDMVWVPGPTAASHAR